MQRWGVGGLQSGLERQLQLLQAKETAMMHIIRDLPAGSTVTIRYEQGL